MSHSNFLFQKEIHQHMKEKKAIKWHYSFTGAALNNWLEYVIKNENTTVEICITDERNARGRNRRTEAAEEESANTLWSHDQLTDPSDHDCRMSITQRTTADWKMSRNQPEIQLLRINRKAECTVKETVHPKIYICWKCAHPQVI